MQKRPQANAQEQRSSAFAAFCSATCPRKAVTWALLWSSLPTASKLLVVFVLGQAGLWLGYTAGNGARIATMCVNAAAGELCTAEQWQAMASTLAAQLSLAYLTLDAIHEENSFQMLASTVFIVLSGLLWVAFVAVLGPMMLGWRFAIICSFIAATAINAWLAYITYQQFGWRIHSRLACDYRRKHAAEKLQLYFLVSRFKTLLRFSWHAILVNVVNCAVLALAAHSSAATAAAPAAEQQHLLTVPIHVAEVAPLMQYSLAAAPLADAANNSIDLQQNKTSAYETVEAAVAAAARAAVAGVQSVEAAAIPEQATAASMHSSSSSSSSAVTGLVASLAIWLLPAGWLLVTFLAVARNSNRLQQLSSATLPVLLMLPALPLYWVFSPMYFWPERIVVRVVLLACPMAVWLGLALAVWRTMATLMEQFRLPAVQELLGAAQDGSNDRAYQLDMPEQLQPLLQGAWLLKSLYTLDVASSSSRLTAGVKSNSGIGSSSRFVIQHAGAANTEAPRPVALSSASKSWLEQKGLQLFKCCHSVFTAVLCSSKHWRFFQLSSDLTTLRWAWNKYVLLYYVDSITADADRLTITLHMVLDPDLTLAFDNPKTYDHWESALQLLLHMLSGAAPGSGWHSDKGATNSSSSIQARHDAAFLPAGCEESVENMLGSEQWKAPAAVRAPSCSQHSLVMTALNVQYGLQGGAGSVALGGSMSAGLAANGKSRNSFLRSSRRNSVTDPEARKLRQAQSMVELMSQQLSSTSASFSAAQQSSRCSPFQQQQDWQQLHEEWQQQRCEPSVAAAAVHVAARSPTGSTAASAAMRAASQVLLLPHQLATHQQQQQQQQQDDGQLSQQQQQQQQQWPQCALGTTAVKSPRLGPFRTPLGLLQHLQLHQQLSSWQEPDSSSGGEAATLSTSYIQSGTSSHATPMHSGSLVNAVLRSPAKQYQEGMHCSDDGSMNLDARVGAASSGGCSRMQPQQLQQQQHGDMHSSERCFEQRQGNRCQLQNSSVGRSGYISPCKSPEPASMLGKATLLAAQQRMPQQLQPQPLITVMPGNLPIQQQHQQQQQVSSAHGAGNVPGASMKSVSPYQLGFQLALPKMLRSNSMPASLEAFSKDMQQAVVAVAAEVDSLVTNEQRLSRTALAVSSCSALGGMLQGIAAGKPGSCAANCKDAHGIGAFMPPLPENAGSGIRAVWGSDDAESAADSVQASAGGSMGVLSSTAGGSQGETSYPGVPGWGQEEVARPGPDNCPQSQPGGHRLSDYSTAGCGRAAVRPDDSTLRSAESQASSNPCTRPDNRAGDVAIAIEQAGVASSCSSQQPEVFGMQAVASTGTWKASLQSVLASFSGAVAQRVAGTSSNSILQHQMHGAATAAAVAAPGSCHSNGMLAAASQLASPLSQSQHIDSSHWVPAVAGPNAQPLNSHGSFSTIGWSAASRSNTPWSNVGSMDHLHSPGGSGPALAAAAPGQFKVLACRTSTQSPSWQEAGGAGADLATAVAAAAAVHGNVLVSKATSSHNVPPAQLPQKQTPPAPCFPSPTAAAAGAPFATYEVAAQTASAGKGQVQRASTIQAPAQDWNSSSPVGSMSEPAGTKTDNAAPAEESDLSMQLGSTSEPAGTTTNRAAVLKEGMHCSASRIAHVVNAVSQGLSALMPVSQQHCQPPRLAYGVTAGSELRRLGSVSFNSMPQLPVLPEAPASAELDSNEHSNEEAATRSGSSSSSNRDSSAVGGNKLLQQQVACSSNQVDGTKPKQQSPFMTLNFAAAEQQQAPQQQQPFTLQAAYHYATSRATRDDLPPSPRSPKSPRAAWLRQQQQGPHIQQLCMSDGMPHGLGSQGSGVLRLQGSGHLGSQSSGRLGPQGSGHLGAHGSGRLAAQGSGHLGSQGSGRLAPQGSGRLAAQGSWGLRAQGYMHLSTQGQIGLQGSGQNGLADPMESPRGTKLSVKIPDTRRPSAQGQQLVHGHWGTAAHALPYQGTLGYFQPHVPKGTVAHEDLYGAAVTTPEGLASYPSHASMISDWNVGGLNSPLTARANTFSMASGGYWGSMQLTSSGSFGGWSAFTAGSGHSKASSFKTGMAPQVSVEVIDWHCLQLGKRIGRGAEGSVYEARLQDAPVAVKEGPGMQEIEMYLAAGVHDNVVGLRGLCHRDDGTWCLVLEWCRGTLDTLLHHSSSPLPRAQHPPRGSSNGGGSRSSSSSDGGRGTPTAAAAAAVKTAHCAAPTPHHPPGSAATAAATRRVATPGVEAAATGLHSRPDLVKVLPLMRSIARGLLHLHSRRPAILHRDIKPANIFVGHGMVMKIGDFGMSRHVFPTPADTAAAGSRSSWGSAAAAAGRQGSSNGGGGLRSSIAGTRECRRSAAGSTNSSRQPDSAIPGALSPAPSPAGLGGSNSNVQQQPQKGQPQVHHHHQQQHQEQLLPVIGVGCSAAAPAVPVRTLTPGVVGTIAYSAPEVLDEQLQQPNPTVERILKADVYSLGVTMWEMLERRRPLEGLDGMQICAMWIADPQQMVLPPLTVADNANEHEKRVLAALQDLVRDCTAFNPDARPTMKQVLERIRQAQRLCDPKTAAGAAAATAVVAAAAAAVADGPQIARLVADSSASGNARAGSSARTRSAVFPGDCNECEHVVSTTPASSRLVPAAAGSVAAEPVTSKMSLAVGVAAPAAGTASAAASASSTAQDTTTYSKTVTGYVGSASSATACGPVLPVASNDGPCTDRQHSPTDVDGHSSRTRHKRSSSDADAQLAALSPLQGPQDPLWHSSSLPPRLSVGRDRRVSGQGLMQRHMH